MTTAERNQWARLALLTRKASAAVEALSCGHINTHQQSLGDPRQSMARAAATLDEAARLAKELSERTHGH